jgi:hypothetical protein
LTSKSSDLLVRVAEHTITKADAIGSGMTGCVFRVYEKLASMNGGKQLPLHHKYLRNWGYATDQRPLMWNSPQVSEAAKSKTAYSPAHQLNKGIVGSSGASFTATLDGTKLSAAIATTGTQLVFTGTMFSVAANGPAGNMLDLMGFFPSSRGAPSGTPAVSTTSRFLLTLSGCTGADTGYNREYYITGTATTAGTSTTFTIGGNAGRVDVLGISTASDDATICVGDTITLQSRMPSLIDSKAIAIGDRVKIQSGAYFGRYDTRTVDKIWGTGNDVTQFSVDSAFTSSDLGIAKYAWVDESGSTESATCGNRGLCDGETGVCECFKGYTGGDCGQQDAVCQ